MLQEIKCFHDNGNVYYTYYVDNNGKTQGMYELFSYYSGKKVVERSYKDGERYGINIHYSLFQKDSICIYKKGILHGIKIGFRFKQKQ